VFIDDELTANYNRIRFVGNILLGHLGRVLRKMKSSDHLFKFNENGLMD